MDSDQAPEHTAATAARGESSKKRTRIAIACLRCKSRKQKCSGQQPKCSSCASAGSTCEYDMSASIPHRRIQYQRAMQRIEELEAILSQAGLLDSQLAGVREGEASPATKTTLPLKRTRDQLEETSLSAENVGDDPGSPHSMDSFVDVLRDLSIEAAGGYVNASSNISMARMLDSLVQAKEANMPKSGRILDELLSPKSTNGATNASSPPSDLTLDVILPSVADRMLYGYFRHIFTLWPVLPTGFIWKLHMERLRLKDRFEIAALHLIYGIGGRYLETTGEIGNFRSEEHYAKASALLEYVLLLNDIRSVQILLLFAIYGLRAPRGPGAWSFVGMAMRISIELGLHRRSRTGSHNNRSEELRRCVFWSCYCLDRQISIILGRPFAISDRDIDAELPSGIDHLNDCSAAAKDGPMQATSMQCFLHICRLRIIESRIQQAVYRVDRLDASTSEPETFINELEDWKANIPFDAQMAEPTSINAFDYYMVYYYKCLRFLLHPHVSSQEPMLCYLQKCVEACGGVCQTYKRLHQNVAVGFSLMALHSVFFAGLTLLYCAWVSPKELFNMRNSSHLNACSIVLYIIAERWPGARRYRDMFESLKQAVIEAIEEGQYEPRQTIKRLKPDIQEALRDMQTTEANQDDFFAMLAEMSGDMVDTNTYDQELNYSDLPAFSLDMAMPLLPVLSGNASDSIPSAGEDFSGQALGSMDPETFSWLL